MSVVDADLQKLFDHAEANRDAFVAHNLGLSGGMVVKVGVLEIKRPLPISRI